MDKRLFAALMVRTEPIEFIRRLIAGTSAENDPLVNALLERLELVDEDKELQNEAEELRGEIEELRMQAECLRSEVERLQNEEEELEDKVEGLQQKPAPRATPVKTEKRGRKNIYRSKIESILNEAGKAAQRSYIISEIMKNPPPGTKPSKTRVYNAMAAMLEAGLLVEMPDGSVSL